MSKKSTRGVLLFAIDTDTRSYVKMANYCAKQIRCHLNLPVTVITTGGVDRELFDRVITVTPSKKQQRGIAGRTEEWNNFGRHSAYHVSPYDETLLLDTDYICNSDQLLKLFDMGQDFLCHRTRRYLGARHETTTEQYGKNWDMWWATVIYFKRCDYSESVFDMMKMIEDNYGHYSKIYGFRTTPYRNDYALSIAVNTVSGHIDPKTIEIPWTLINVEFETEIKLDNGEWTISFDKQVDSDVRRYRITTKNQDLHVLNKDALDRIIDEQAN
jgi:hypothetical protein